MCVRMSVCFLFGSVALCIFTFISHVNVAGVSCSVLGHVTDTCRRRVQRRAANRSLSRHEPASFSSSLPLTFASLLLLPPLSPLNTLHFPSGLPLPPCPGSAPAPAQSGFGAKAQPVPCRDHMDSGVLLSRARHIVSTRQVLSNQPLCHHQH